MKPYKVDTLLTKLKQVYAEKAVETGFDDDSIYSDELFMTDKHALDEFNKLKAIVGTTKKEKAPTEIDVNNNHLDDEEYDTAIEAKKKPKKERTPEEQAALDKLNAVKKQKKTLVSILRSISIRIPLMIYGMNMDINEDVDIHSFVNKVDDESWQEFMPNGVTKDLFRKFIKYYDPEIFIEAGKIIRNRVKSFDNMDPLERAENIALVFNHFKNPDKETVLTPWRVVNMQLGKTIGGLSFFDDDYKETMIDGKSATHWINTDLTDEAFKTDTHILEINAKTGLYPLYAAASLYYRQLMLLNDQQAGKFNLRDEQAIWRNVLKNNIFVIAKTPMAKTITERTLCGFKDYEVNTKYIQNIVENAKKDIDEEAKQIKEEFNNMKFDVVIGNPPYQESDNSGSKGSAKPIYHYFVRLAKKLNPSYISLITPSVWFTGGKGLNDYREEMLNDSHIKYISNYITPKEIFPTANLRGGVNFFLWDKNYNNKIRGVTIDTIKNSKLIETGKRSLKLADLDVLISSNLSFGILNNLITNNLISLDINDSKNFSSIVSVRNPFGFNTNFKKDKEFHIDKNGLLNPVKIYASGGVIGFVERNLIDKNVEWIDKIKVLTPFANNIGTDLNDNNLNTIIALNNSIATETFLVIGANMNLTIEEAKNISKYLKTKFTRFLISMAKANQNGTRITYRFIPMQDFSNNSDIKWSESLTNIDNQLFKKYMLSEEEVEYIKESINN